jgi:hypothetical protein
MKIAEIQTGKIYLGKINNRTTKLRVDSIQLYRAWPNDERRSYRIGITNLETGRQTTFHSAAPEEPTPTTTSYKVGVKTAGDTDWVTNGLRFATEEQAKNYGADLAWRWTAVNDWTVLPSDELVNCDANGRLIRTEAN